MTLTREQIDKVNEIYFRVFNKYFANSTENRFLESPPHLSMEDARELAELELGNRRLQIMNEYDERVENINRNATARRIMNSSMVCQMLDKAFARKTDALKRLDGQIDRLAKRLHTENGRAILAIESHKSSARSRSLRDVFARVRLADAFNAQELFNQEIHIAYLEWLLQFQPIDALSMVVTNRIFRDNMGLTAWTRLVEILQTRAGV